MSPAKVSVVIPFYNPGAFLHEAIESVLAQTYASIELVLVDDGSNDCSVDIAKGFASTFPEKIRYVTHAGRVNRGMAPSRNLGMANSTGEFVAHLDADDVYPPEKIQEQVDVFEAHPEVAMVFGKMLLWRSWSGGKDVAQRFSCPLDTVLNPPTFLRFLLSGRNDPAGYLMRRSAMSEVGGYPVGFEMCEDWGLYVKICLRYPVYVQTNWNYKYRQHENQTCSAARRHGTFYAQFAPFLAWLDDYTRDQGAYVRFVVRYAIRKYSALAACERGLTRIRRLVQSALNRDVATE